GERGVQMLSPDVLEIDVDPLGHRLLECGGEIAGRPVVDRLVDARLALKPGAFLVRAGRTRDEAALRLGDLTDDRADGTARGGDEDPLAILQLTDTEETGIGGQPRHAEG